MSISSYVNRFAEILEKGELITGNLLKEEHSMHVIVAAILRKALKSDVMAEIADGFYEGYQQSVKINSDLKEKIESLSPYEESDDSVEPEVSEPTS